MSRYGDQRNIHSFPTRRSSDLPEDNNEKATTERLLVKKKADLGGDRVTESHAYYGNEGWTVQLKFDSEGAKKFNCTVQPSLPRSEEHTSELQSRGHLVCRLLLE